MDVDELIDYLAGLDGDLDPEDDPADDHDEPPEGSAFWHLDWDAMTEPTHGDAPRAWDWPWLHAGLPDGLAPGSVIGERVLPERR